MSILKGAFITVFSLAGFSVSLPIGDGHFASRPTSEVSPNTRAWAKFWGIRLAQLDQYREELRREAKKAGSQSLDFLRMGAGEIESILKKSYRSKFARFKNPEKELTNFSRHIERLCRRHGFDPAEILSLIHKESSFNRKAISKVGAIGLMQLMPKTAMYIVQKIGRLKHLSQISEEDLFDPYINTELGIAYLAYLRRRFKSSHVYLAAYNLGPTTVGRMVRNKNFRLGAVEDYVYDIQDRIGEFHQEIHDDEEKASDAKS